MGGGGAKWVMKRGTCALRTMRMERRHFTNSVLPVLNRTVRIVRYYATHFSPVMGTHLFIRYIVAITVTSLVTTITNKHLQ
jgi:hypothetical protein